MSTNYEPTAEQVRRLKDELTDSCECTITDEHAVMVLQRQHSREAGLLQTLRSIKYLAVEGSAVHTSASDALAAHSALDAAPEPTLLEAAKRMVSSYHDDEVATVNVEFGHFVALKAAVERAEQERAK